LRRKLSGQPINTEKEVFNFKILKYFILISKIMYFNILKLNTSFSSEEKREIKRKIEKEIDT